MFKKFRGKHSGDIITIPWFQELTFLLSSVAAILSHLTVQDSDSYRNASPV